MIPREHHILSGEPFKPEYYSGSTMEEKIANAKAALLREINSYVKQIEKKKPDENFVTTDSVRIDIVEPKTRTYADPNELIEQLNLSIKETIGLPEPKKGTFAAGLIEKGYSALRAEMICMLIVEAFLDVIKRVMVKKFGGKVSVIQQIEPIVQLVLEIDYTDRARAIAILKETGLFTIKELRKMWDTRMGVPEGEVVSGPTKRGKTPEEVTADTLRRELPPEGRNPMTPESRRRTEE